ncbi:hypothetical protein JCM8547_003459 [Rhodosporidiobolus lusitaniae]
MAQTRLRGRNTMAEQSTEQPQPAAPSLDAPSAVASSSTSLPLSTSASLSFDSTATTADTLPPSSSTTPAPAPANPSALEPSAPPPAAPSKSALKRQRKQEAFAAQKLQRRAYEKEKKRSKAAEIKRLVAEGVMEKPPSKKKHNKGGKGKGGGGEQHGARIAIDMGFDELMSEKEVKSMASQLAYCYSSNRAASRPFPLLVTSFNGRLREMFEKRKDYKSWRGVEWWEEGIEALFEGREEEKDKTAGEPPAGGEEAAAAVDPPSSSTSTSTLAVDPTPSTSTLPSAPPSADSSAPPSASTSSTPSPPLIQLGSLSNHPRSSAPKPTLIYLTGDSPHVLTRLTPGHTYILGGIVDRNRYKSLCLHKAEKLGIRHAQLPIGEFLPEMGTRKVLTVNQVFEILVKQVEMEERYEAEAEAGEGAEEEGGEVEGEEKKNAWRDALRAVMPVRKFDPDQRKKRKEASLAAKLAGGEEGVYVAQEGEEDEEGEDEGMLIVEKKVEEARGKAEKVEEEKEHGKVLVNVDAEALP